MNKFQLEGEYIVHIYNECDYESEGRGLRIDFFKNSKKVECVLNPGGIWSPSELNERSIYSPNKKEYIYPTEKAIEILEERKVTSVTTIFRNINFYRLPYGVQCLDNEGADEQEGICNNWFELKPVCIDTEKYKLITSRGIKVKLFDVKTMKYF